MCYFNINQLILVLVGQTSTRSKKGKPMAEYVAWYVDTLNHVHTNSVVAGMALEEDICPDKLCSDGKKRNLWRCDHGAINTLVENREELQLHFQIYRQKGKHGNVEHWTFENFKASGVRRPSAAKRVAMLEREAEEIYA